MGTLISCRSLGLQPTHEGKVRDVFDLGEHLLLVATDRISAYDVIMPNPIPDKGILLTQMTLAWYEFFGQEASRQLVSTDPREYPDPFAVHAESLSGRSMLVKKAQRFDVECIVRGYLAGSGWREYRKSGKVGGIEVGAGLKESDAFEEPLFTPTTKAEEGHDENMTFEEVVELVGSEVARELKQRSIRYYVGARDHARGRGIIIADTKFEFGRVGGEISLIDEMLSPDSSRFWPADEYEPGRTQMALDKQFLRDYLDSIRWDHSPPAPGLPDEIVEKTRSRYFEAMDRLFGTERVEPFLREEVDSN